MEGRNPLPCLLIGQRLSRGDRPPVSLWTTSFLCPHSYAFGRPEGPLQPLLLCSERLGPFTHRCQAATAHPPTATQAASAAPRGPPPAPGTSLPLHAPQQLRVSPSRPAPSPDGGRTQRSCPPGPLCYIGVLSDRGSNTQRCFRCQQRTYSKDE